MDIDIVPFATFVLVTTFTPGPNNISSASMAVLYGYKNTLHYMCGIAAGFFLIMLLCAYVSSALLRYLPAAEPVLRMIGAAYILWLATHTARASYGFNSRDHAPLGFVRGFFLQAINPKVAVYGLANYTTFLSPLADKPLILSIFALFFALTAFGATSTWALCGAAIRTRLHQPRVRLMVNTVLVLLLVYSAIDLSGIFSMLG